MRYTGQVKFYNRDRGFGFVTRMEDNKDFFLHYQDIKPKGDCWNILFQGEYIEFTLRDGPNGQQAGDITGINGGSLLCENQFNPQTINKKKRRKPIHNNTLNQPESKFQCVEGDIPGNMV